MKKIVSLITTRGAKLLACKGNFVTTSTSITHRGKDVNPAARQSKSLRWGVILVIFLLMFVFMGAAPFKRVLPNRPVRRTNAAQSIDLPIIMYHSVLKSRSGKFIVSPDMLERDMRFLLGRGYTTVFTQEVIDFVNCIGELPEKPIIVTFDDGYYNNLHYALPIFEKLDIKGVINVVGHYADKAVAENDTNPQYSHLTWEQTRQIRDSGRFEVGNHTYDMHNHRGRLGVTKKRGESFDEYRAALEKDIGKLQKDLTDKSGITPNIFAYPFGKYSKETKKILRGMGFEAIFTCNEGINKISRGDTETLLRLKRYNRPGKCSTEKFFEKLGIDA